MKPHHTTFCLLSDMVIWEPAKGAHFGLFVLLICELMSGCSVIREGSKSVMLQNIY
jgi:hypothetical protein